MGYLENWLELQEFGKISFFTHISQHINITVVLTQNYSFLEL
jgi:hypothetical protein